MFLNALPIITLVNHHIRPNLNRGKLKHTLLLAMKNWLENLKNISRLDLGMLLLTKDFGQKLFD